MDSQIQLKRTGLTLLVGIAVVLVHFSAFAAKDGNTSFGVGALPGNTAGDQNTAMGNDALKSNTTGSRNTAIGFWALLGNTAGNGNVANGAFALNNNASGIGNTAVGTNALVNNTTGRGNIALGIGAGLNLTMGDNDIYIGNRGVSPESGTIRIGTEGTHAKTFIAGISGTAIMSGPNVVVDGNGQLGVLVSSARFKEQIKPMDKSSEAILSLKPVMFRYKKQLDPNRTQQFGLLAEEVDKVNPALVSRDAEGKPYTVRYEAVNAMLLNEFLKEHGKVQQQDATIAQLKKQVEALTRGLQKVSAQLEVSKPAPQTVLNNQ